jgi:hypothetical protein
MVETKERASREVHALPVRALVDSSSSQLDAVVTPKLGRRRQIGHFVVHYFEMCLPMCIGFALGDLVYFWVARQFGYSHPFRQLPELSVLVVTFNMTAPMVVWMLFRGMRRRPTTEMAAAMPILALVLLVLGWLAILPKADLALWEHGLMMPVMLVPMLFRIDVYTGRAGHTMQSRITATAIARFSSTTAEPVRRTSSP